MIVSFLILLAATAALAVYAWRRDPATLPAAGTFAAKEGARLALRLPIALFAASCLAELVPDRVIAAVMGAETGLWGILFASVAGGLLPGGPMVAFPLALVLVSEGSGGPQTVALVTGWSVFAFHRVISYEGPMMGWRFVILRFVCSWWIPPLCGLLAGLFALIGLDARPH